jgi:hypothetical protein
MAAIIIRLLLFALPFLIFFLVMRMLKRRIKDGDKNEPELERRIGYASIAGVVVLLGGIGYILATSSSNKDQTYIPPKEVDGEIVPGHFEDKKD